MALATYTDLRAAVSSTLMRGDLDAMIPDWVEMCEANLRRVLKGQDNIMRAYINAGGADERYENLPADFWEMVSPPRTDADSGDTPMEYVTPRMMDYFWASPATGTARYYTLVGKQIQFYPQPVAAKVEIAYRQSFPALATAPGGTNLLLQTDPDLYLYGTLLHSAPALHEDERVQTWAALYQKAVDEYNLAHLRKRFTQGPLTMRTRRVF